MKTAKALLIKVLNEWHNPDELDLMTILSKKSLPFMEKAMQEYAEQQAIEFAKWIADFISEDEHGGEHSDNFQLIDGNYYWKDDEDGDQPLSEEQLYKMFLAENNTL